MKQTFDLDTMLFNLLKGSPEVVSEISGDVYSLGERPDDSQETSIHLVKGPTIHKTKTLLSIQ